MDFDLPRELSDYLAEPDAFIDRRDGWKAWLDRHGTFAAPEQVSMCNYWANRLCCEAADRAMQVHGGLGPGTRKRPRVR